MDWSTNISKSFKLFQYAIFKSIVYLPLSNLGNKHCTYHTFSVFFWFTFYLNVKFQLEIIFRTKVRSVRKIVSYLYLKKLI